MASLLAATDLAAMKAAQASALPLTCIISRRALSPDGAGGYTESWSNLATNVACRLAPLGTPSEVVVAERFAGRQQWQLTLPTGQDITHEDRVVIGGVTYEVVGLNSAGAWETARRAILVRAL